MGLTFVIPSWPSGDSRLPNTSLTLRFLYLIPGEPHGIGAMRSEIGFAVQRPTRPPCAARRRFARMLFV
jgi:hypothetical protein